MAIWPDDDESEMWELPPEHEEAVPVCATCGRGPCECPYPWEAHAPLAATAAHVGRGHGPRSRGAHQAGCPLRRHVCRRFRRAAHARLGAAARELHHVLGVEGAAFRDVLLSLARNAQGIEVA